MKITYRLSISLFIALFTVIMVYPVHVAESADLNTPRIYLNRTDPSLQSGVELEIFFTTVGAVAGGVGNNDIILVFPDADDGTWCYATGTDMTVLGITDPTDGSESATVLPGAFTSSTCTQGAGGSSYDTITIETVNDLAATTKYGVRISDGTNLKIGTPLASTTGIINIETNDGSPVDSADTAVDIVADDEIAVSATVPPTITFTISSNTAALGTLSTGAVSTANHTIRTESNAGSGYISRVYDDGNLRDGGNDIDDVAGGTIVAGTEEYGLGTSDDGRTIAEDDDCSNTPFNATALTTSMQDVAGESSGPVDETITVCYQATISSTTNAGSYSSVVYYVTAGLF